MLQIGIGNGSLAPQPLLFCFVFSLSLPAFPFGSFSVSLLCFISKVYVSANNKRTTTEEQK